MTRFSRRAGWLPQLFTPSVAPTSSFPDRYSSEVNLVQNYDGGGWGIPNPAEMFLTVNSLIGANRDTTILTVGNLEIVRLVALSAQVIAGGVPTGSNAILREPQAALNVGVNNLIALDATALVGFEGLPKVIPPSWELVGSYQGGDAASQVTWRCCFLRLPLGSAPCL